MNALDRMFRVLVRTIREKQPALLTAPFTVAELYQQLLPYRHYRRELALETNQEYELVLMELLSGGGGFLDVDEQLRDELGKELASSSPEPSRVRDFPEAHVAIKSAALTAISDGSGSTPSRAAGTAAGRNAPVASSPPAPATTGSRCRFCAGDLPKGRTVHFCPHCGQNLQVLNCPACGAEVEAGWRFCVTCGKAVS
jgi:Double zinc ribbon